MVETGYEPTNVGVVGRTLKPPSLFRCPSAGSAADLRDQWAPGSTFPLNSEATLPRWLCAAPSASPTSSGVREVERNLGEVLTGVPRGS
jgi:hypothetical protein